MIALRTTAHTFGAYSTVGVRYVIHRLAQICAAGGAGGPKPASSLGESPTMGRMHQPRTPVPHKPDCTPNMDFLPIPPVGCVTLELDPRPAMGQGPPHPGR